ncbi:MAG: class I SAM-dependent methyltransferase [Candidatus Neomarinimicrobiota bacterium]
MNNKKATDLFNEWALKGKDVGMESGHASSVEVMLQSIIKDQTSPFSFIDAGCGNGWVIRKMCNHPLCDIAIGIDGASEMIKKAKVLDPDGCYHHSDLMQWVPNQLVDFVHSMEVLYYFENPKKIILHMLENWLKPKGTIIMGMDYYSENVNSHSWPKDLNLPMILFSMDEWSDLFQQCGLNNVLSYQINKKFDFPGTLVIKGDIG